MTNIRETLDAIDQSENADVSFIVAAAVNLYTETLRRRRGRVIYTPADADALLKIVDLLMNAPTELDTFLRKGRSHTPTPEEEQDIINVHDAFADLADPKDDPHDKPIPAFVRRPVKVNTDG